MGKNLAQQLIGFLQEFLQSTAHLLADPFVRPLIMGDLGLAADAPAPTTIDQAALDRMNDYFNASDPEIAKYLERVDDYILIAEALKDFLDVARAPGDTRSKAVLFTSLLELVGLSFIRGRYPRLYAIARLVGAIEEPGFTQDLLKGVGHVLRLDRLDQVNDPGDYFQQLIKNTSAKDASDALLGALALFVAAAGDKVLPVTTRALYGWDHPSDVVPPGALEVLDRTLSLRFAPGLDPDDPSVHNCKPIQAGLGLEVDVMYVPAEPGHSQGLFVAARGTDVLTIPFDPIKVAGRAPVPRGNIVLTFQLPGQLNFFIGDPFQFLGSSLASASLTAEYEPNNDPALPTSTILLGAANSSRIEVGRVGVRGQLGITTSGSGVSADYGIRLGLDTAAVILKGGEGDGFIASILRLLTSGGDMKLSFSLAVGVSKGRGFFIEGGTGLRVTIAIAKALGPIKIDTLVLGLDLGTKDGVFKVHAEAGLGLSFQTTGVTMVVDQVGVEWQLRPMGSLGFKPPKGLGLSIDLSGVSGGGYLFFDPEHGQYAGAVHLAFAGLAINGVGVVQSFTRPDGSKAYAFVVILSVEFPGGIQLGFGFKLSAIGGLFGQNRAVSTEALQLGIKSGALDAVLFPQNPVANATRIISTLSSVFPVSDGQTIFGPMLKLAWGTPTFIEVSLGLIIEFAPPRRFVLLGKAVADFPDKAHSKFHLELDCVGIFNTSTGESSFDASLYRSTVGPYTLVGDIVWRSAGGGRPFWILAVGGTNPHFEVPKGLLPPMNRVGINLVTGDNPRAWLSGYTAITSNTFQIGGAVDAYYSKAGFNLSAHIGVDALINTATFKFIVDFHLSAALKRGSTNIASIGLSGTITGPKPLHFDGSASIGFFFFSISFHVSFTIGKEDPAPLPSFSVRDPLMAALNDAHNWSGALPESEAMLVSLTKATQPSGDPEQDIIVHPLGQLVVRERVTPIGIQLQKFGAGTISGDSLFTLDDVSLGGGTDVTPTPAVDFFPAGDFLELTDAQKLSRPAFENMQSGLTFAADTIRTGDPVPVALKYKTILRKKGAARQTAPIYVPRVNRFLAAVRAGAAAQSPLRASGLKRFAGLTLQGLAINDPRYTVVSTADLKQPAGLPLNIRAGATYAQAVQALRQLAGSGAGASLHVAAIHEVQS